MPSEQLYNDGKHVGEIIQLDETWTIKIEYGIMKSEDPFIFFYNLGCKPHFRLANYRLKQKHNEALLKEITDSLGKTDRLDANIRKVTVYNDEEVLSETFLP